ncbi:MAG: ATP-binding protein [Spirochaetaceae bacterium]|jgi:PAS domain S-box-containing protein|nr:ATP-binding protein [Spirochaetaceae bacterium]
MKISQRFLTNSILVLSLGIAVGFFFIGNKFLRDLKQLREDERVSFQESYRVSQYYSDLQRALGFGGYIQSLKIYLINREPFQLYLLKANIQEINDSYDKLMEYFRDSESPSALDALDRFIEAISDSYVILRSPENQNLSAHELDTLLQLEAPEVLSGLITLETLKDNYRRRASQNIQCSIKLLVKDLYLASLLLPAILMLGFILIFLLKRANKISSMLKITQRELLREIGNRKIAEQKLLKREKNLSRALKVGKMGSWSVDLHDNHLSWSEEVFRILNMQPNADLTFEDFLGMIHPDDKDMVSQSWEKAIQGGTYDIEHRMIANHQEKWFREIGEVVFDNQGQPLEALGTIQDITERKAMQDQLNQDHKMKALGLLAGGVAHDFNNILTGILTAAQLLENNNEVGEESRSFIEIIIDSSIRAATLVQKMLVFSGKSPMFKTSLDIKDLLDNVLTILNSMLDKKIEIIYNKPQGLFPILGDLAMLQNALINLAINASQAMPLGGELSLTLHETAEEYSLNPNLEQKHYYTLEISDTGCGIPEEYLEKIFDPFFTSKRKERGTGLGLASVYRTIIDHQGYIKVESVIDQGTTFMIFLPQAE